MRTFVVAFAALALGGAAGPVVLAEEAPPPTAPEVLRVATPFGEGSGDASAFQAELDAYAADRNVTIVVEDYVDLDPTITGPNPPDLVVIPQPGVLREYAAELVDLGSYIKQDKLTRDYGAHLIDQASVDGTVLGVPVKADLKSLVWYRPDAFAANGYAVPTTFAELVALSDAMVADGWTPWCNYMESGFATGWVGTDWVEDLLLGAEGTDVYDQWVAHDVLFQDPRVELAFQRYQQMIDTPGYVFDRSNMIAVPFFENAYPLGFGDCLMHKQATFFAAFLGSAGFDLDEFATFEFPAIVPEYADAAMGSGVYVSAITDSTEVRLLVKFMAGPRFGKYAIADSGTGWILPNIRFNLTRYGDDMTRSFAETVTTAIAADQFRFDGSDLMPPEVGAGQFWFGMVDLVIGAKTIPQVLVEIDAAWPT